MVQPGSSSQVVHTTDVEESMESLLAQSTESMTVKQGDFINGRIVKKERGEYLVDIGLKTEAILSNKELPATGYGSESELEINHEVLVYVQHVDTDGKILVSLKRALAERNWQVAEEKFNNKEIISAQVTDMNKGGLIVDVDSIRGFVPISQILNFVRRDANSTDDDTMLRLEAMKGQTLKLQIIEINHARNRLILSEKQAMREMKSSKRDELIEQLQPGDIRKGIISNTASFGAFVDLGGADGLVHISQLAWSRVDHPDQVVKVGQEVEVQVLSVDKEKKKIALSLKQAGRDPWITVEERYTTGQIVQGTITKIAPFGAFARIEDGIEGLIHSSELPADTDIRSVLGEGTELPLRIKKIDSVNRKLGLTPNLTDEASVEASAEINATEAGNPSTGTPVVPRKSRKVVPAQTSSDTNTTEEPVKDEQETALGAAMSAAMRKREQKTLGSDEEK